MRPARPAARLLSTLALAGLSAALLPAQNPGSFAAFGAGCPPPTGSLSAEFYEFFGGPAVDLGGTSFELTLLGTFGYRVQACATSCFQTGFSSRVMLADDQVAICNLPFSFPHPGGTTNRIGFCSNGYLWLVGTNFQADFTPTVSEFLSGDPRLAPLWTDLDPSAGGQTYCDTTATEAVFTWSNVPEFGSTGNTNTFQVRLFADGRVLLSYQNLRVGPGHSVLAGYSRGGGVPDPGPVDLTAAIPFSTGNGTRPPALGGMGNPTIGQTFNLQVSLQPQGSAAGFLVLGATRLAHPLDPLGMPNCTQYTSLDTSLFFLPTPPATLVGQPIPNAASLVGTVVFAQAALFVPGINPLGVATSNGGQITIGN